MRRGLEKIAAAATAVAAAMAVTAVEAATRALVGNSNVNREQ